MHWQKLSEKNLANKNNHPMFYREKLFCPTSEMEQLYLTTTSGRKLKQRQNHGFKSIFEGTKHSEYRSDYIM